MEIHLFRHGETDFNKNRRIQGQSDSVLTPEGIEQDKQLSQRIGTLEYDKVFCSTSVRTRETAEHAFASRQDIVYLDSLREIYLGAWEGEYYAEIEKREPVSFDHFWNRPDLFNCSGKVGNAETFAQLQTRAMDTIAQIRSEYPGQRIAIVSHGALLKAFLCYIERRELKNLWNPPHMHNCAHSIVKFTTDGLGLITQYADQKTNL